MIRVAEILRKPKKSRHRLGTAEPKPPTPSWNCLNKRCTQCIKRSCTCACHTGNGNGA